LTRKHFTEAMNSARRSVTSVDLEKYEQFRRKFDPVYAAKQGGGETKFQWANSGGQQQGGQPQAQQGSMFSRNQPQNDDDLYS